jgi:glycosyltransferase involved in cell wall biosynthesis/spore maturation protein CgeB
MKLLMCNSSLNPVNKYIGESMVRAAARDSTVQRISLSYQKDLGALAASGDFDHLLIIDGQEANTNVIALARKHVCSSSIWFFEDPYELKTNLAIEGQFDTVFTNDYESRSRYTRHAIFLPLGADPDTCFFYPQRSWPIDICFIGSAWPNRCEILFELYSRFPTLNWHVRLLCNSSVEPILAKNGWIDRARHLGWEVTYDSLPIRDVAAFANRSRINLSLPRTFSLGSPAFFAKSGTLAPRVFETAMAGSCQITSADTEVTANQLFPDGSILAYESFDQLCGQIEMLMSDAEKCHELARNAQATCLSNHTYSNRLSIITSSISKDEKIGHLPTRRPSDAVRDASDPLLIIAHNRLGQKPFGGVEVFADRLLRAWTGPAFLAAPLRERGTVGYTITDRDGTEIARVNTPVRPVETLEDAQLESWIEEFVIGKKISTVFFAHLIHWPLSLVRRLSALGILTPLKLNEFFYVCPSINMLSVSDTFCRRDTLGEHFCDDCLLGRFNMPKGTMAARMKIMSDVLKSASHLIAPSESTKDIYGAIYPELRPQIIVKSYPIAPIAGDIQRRESATPGLRVLVPGNFVRQKGAQEILQIIKSLGSDVRFDICGNVDTAYKSSFAELSKNNPNLKLYGGYSASELPNSFGASDVALFLSIWPETFLIAMTEAMLCGCVPIIFSLGAPSERVIDGVNGFCFAPGDWEGVAKLLKRLAIDKSELEQMRNRCISTPHVSEMEYVDFLRMLTAPYMDYYDVATPSGLRILSNAQLAIEYQQTQPFTPYVKKRKGLRKVWHRFRKIWRK